MATILLIVLTIVLGAIAVAIFLYSPGPKSCACGHLTWEHNDMGCKYNSANAFMKRIQLGFCSCRRPQKDAVA